MEILRRFGTRRPKVSAWTGQQSKSATRTCPSASSSSSSTSPFTITPPTRRPPPPSNNNMAAPPPPYSATPTGPADLSSPLQVTGVAADDSPYAFLREFNTVFLIDDSGSMAGRSWRETMAALSAIAPICTAHDADGIDVYFLNHRNPNPNPSPNCRLGGYTNITTTAAVQHLFQSVRPLGGTPTGTRLNQLLKPYLAELADSAEQQQQTHLQGRGRGGSRGASVGNETEVDVAAVKPLNIIVITDGVPSDDVESVIVTAAKKLDAMGAEPWQVGVQFFQVGREPEAAENLRELDDALAGQYGVRDMVDTVPFTGDEGQELTAQGLLKVCLGSVVRRHDRRAV
ncbi:hypothetical protein A1O1_04205 [Capronia coronata CBS 617.96]|uniref:VWFA domain-containing protein n=1 Tax=Capronia coronata CBS 617.96 TaxID=1182541 RepID=W9YEX2_9EURO|nr:uncharacterized protein A1O1_04205 [Capronia coronata CBS 617.96]EXJ91098.1 hypothetical protein A1O1_04205 [Capronia coronata CBS 617.96]